MPESRPQKNKHEILKTDRTRRRGHRRLRGLRQRHLDPAGRSRLRHRVPGLITRSTVSITSTNISSTTITTITTIIITIIIGFIMIIISTIIGLVLLVLLLIWSGLPGLGRVSAGRDGPADGDRRGRHEPRHRGGGLPLREPDALRRRHGQPLGPPGADGGHRGHRGI